MVHAHHIGSRITGRGGSGGSRVGATRDQGGSGHGETGVGHGECRGSGANIFLLDGIDAPERSRVDWGVGVRRSVR